MKHDRRLDHVIADASVELLKHGQRAEIEADDWSASAPIPPATAYFTAAWRAVATAKIGEFAWQCETLGTLAHCGAVDRSAAASVLNDIADAHSLGETFGHDYVADMIADAFTPPAKKVGVAA